MTKLSLLTFTTLFPNALRPNHGVFVENRLRHLVAGGEVSSCVVAPVPWYWRAPREEMRHGVRVLHPRWPAIPLIGMNVAPALLFAAARRQVAALLREGMRFDAIDAHYFYPDGIAAIRLGADFCLPVVITARGSDVTQFPDYALPRRWILDAASSASAVITVSAGLRSALIGLGAEAAKIHVLRNGIDLSAFRPMDRSAARSRFGVTQNCLVSVGALIPRKGHDRTIAALCHLPEWCLLIAGAGPERAALEVLAAGLGIAGRVRFLGSVPHADLAWLYSAADLSVLASSREGWANVLLESMACGTPVVASPIAGNDEVVLTSAAGRLAAANSAQGIADAVLAIVVDGISRDATRAYAEGFSWDETTAGQIAIFQKIIS